MDLTIIIPCHNLENYIQALLTSLSIQYLSYNVQLIFVLDACTDRTRAVIEAALPWLDQYIVEIHECNYKLPGFARNVGFSYAYSDYIWYIDGDDWLVGDDAIETLIVEAHTMTEDILQFNYEAPNFKGIGHYSMVWQYIFRTSYIQDHKFPAMKSGEDQQFMETLLRRRPSIKKLNRVFYHYNYKREGSTVWMIAHGLT